MSEQDLCQLSAGEALARFHAKVLSPNQWQARRDLSRMESVIPVQHGQRMPGGLGAERLLPWDERANRLATCRPQLGRYPGLSCRRRVRTRASMEGCPPGSLDNG